MERGAEYHEMMTKTKVSSLVIRLGIPTTITMLITNIYNLVDTYFVGTLGVSQQGATGILFTLQAIIQAFAFLLGHGSGTHVAKKLAEKDVDGASKFVSTAFYSGLFIGGLLCLFGIIFLEPFMLLLGSSDTILPYANQYGLWVLISAPFLIGSLVINNNLRYEGKAFFAMIGMATGALLNILGDFVFINLMGLGVFGAGMSTGISQIVSFIILVVFFIVRGQSRITIRMVSFEWRLHLAIIKAGFPSLLRQGLASISGGVLNNLTKPFGDAAVAAISVVNRYSNFLMCVGMGVGQGLQPVAAYNYARKEYGRVRDGCIFTVLFSSGVVALLVIPSLIIPNIIVSWFNTDAEVIELGTYALRIAAISLLFVPISVVINMALQSVRRSFSSSFLSTLRNGIIFIPIIFILVSGAGLGFKGVAWAQPISDLITFLISLPFFILFVKEMGRKEKEKKQAEA